MRAIIRAYLTGLMDGCFHPYDLNFGKGHDEDARQRAYDSGALLGQRIGRWMK